MANGCEPFIKPKAGVSRIVVLAYYKNKTYPKMLVDCKGNHLSRRSSPRISQRQGKSLSIFLDVVYSIYTISESNGIRRGPDLEMANCCEPAIKPKAGCSVSLI